jgi:hypothetical protein
MTADESWAAFRDSTATPRERWKLFRTFVDIAPPLDPQWFATVIAQVSRADDAWLRRACITTLVRTHREVCSDDQLRSIATDFGGKFVRFVDRVLERRATSRARAPSAH